MKDEKTYIHYLIILNYPLKEIFQKDIPVSPLNHKNHRYFHYNSSFLNLLFRITILQVWFFQPGNLEGFLQQIFDLILRDSTALVQPQTGLSQTLSRVLEQTVPGMVQNLDIQNLVENRINDLDVLQVEELLLSIMAKHFKWINLFGGILGALIGALQLIIP